MIEARMVLVAIFNSVGRHILSMEVSKLADFVFVRLPYREARPLATKERHASSDAGSVTGFTV